MAAAGPGPIEYARSGDGTHIAYEVVGSGPVDLVFVPPGVTHLEHLWEHPGYAHAYERLTRFCRLINVNKRGSGLSDRTVDLPTAEQQVEDLMAVLDAAAVERAYLFGALDGGQSCLLLAASHPERTLGIVAWATNARGMWAPDYPMGRKPDEAEALIGGTEASFGRLEAIAALGPVAHEASFGSWMTRMMRSSTTPAAYAQWTRVRLETDIRSALPHVAAPVLLMNRTDNRLVSAEHTRWLASHLTSCRYVELPGENYPWWVGDVDEILDEIEEFVTGERPDITVDRVLATVLFTDLVDSTRTAADVGDARWRRLLDRHDDIVRRQAERHRGRLVKVTGDGALVTFDGPARAVRCALGVRDGLAEIGLTVRAGVHAGEVELRDDDVGGIAVHIAARIQASAGPAEILVSRTVADLVTGSGLRFDSRGVHELRGVPGGWELLAALHDE